MKKLGFQRQASKLTRGATASMLSMLIAIMLCGVGAHAQGYGTISGTVTDPSGAVVPNVTVLATASQTGVQVKAVTNAQGGFTFPTLLPTQYTLSASAPGFQAYQRSGILLQANQALTVNISLAVGSATQTVSVSAAPPQVNTTNGTLSQVIDRSTVLNMPLNGRNAASLILLVSGVANATNEGNGADQGQSKTFPAAVISSSNGTLPNQDNFLLDGGNNVDEQTNVNDPFPFPDALQEFSVQTTNYSAEFGQSAGAVVNIVTKSGTSQFHGDVFEFLRNGFFDASNPFSVTTDTLHRNQFGGVIGGPVIIPHLSHGNATQFFFGWQHTINHSASTGNQSTVPTLAEEGRAPGQTYADFGNWCNTASGHSFDSNGTCVNSSGSAVAAEQIRNPFTNAIYPYNQIPSSDFDPAAVAFEKAFPTYSGPEAPGKIGGPVNYYLPSIQTFNEFVARVDHQFGDSDHLFGRYYYNFFNAPGYFNSSNMLEYLSFADTRYQNALISETHTFSPNIVNNLVVNYQREYTLRGGPPGSPLITDFGVGNVWQPATGPFISATISGYFRAVATANAVFGRNDYNFDDVLHWVKGSHNFAFGGHAELSKYDAINVYTSYGSFSFNSATNKIGQTTYDYPNAMANFQLGFMTGFGQGNYEAVNNRGNFPAVFAQDTWRITRRLVLDYGVRWELFEPWADRLNKQTFFDATKYAEGAGTPQYSTLPAGMVLSGDPGYPENGIRNEYDHFMPRVGFAYDVFGNGKTAVRGGAGIFYQDRLQAWTNLTQSTFVPNTISVALTNPGMYSPTAGSNPGGPFSNPYCTGCAVGSVPNPFPFTKPFGPTQVFPNAFQVASFDPNHFQAPVTYAYNLTLEQQLTGNTSMRLAYVASASRHQMVDLELNPAVNNGSGLGTNYRRVYNTAPTVGPCVAVVGCQTGYSNITLGSMTGAINYNSFQASLHKRMSHGLSFLANFTWSHTLSDMPLSRLSNTEDLNVSQSYVYPIYPANATGIPAAARVSDVKALDRGNSDIDHPIIFSLSYVYSLPRVHNGNGFLRSVANGWMTSGIVSHQSGDALTAYVGGTDTSLTGLGQERAQEDFSMSAYKKGPGLGNCSAGSHCMSWLNDAAFSVPAQNGPGTGFGNVVKGSLRGPGLTNWDAAVMRTFPIYRESNLEFRAEYFNLLNHPELAAPNTNNPTSSSFGTITKIQSGSSPRTAQFSLKYRF